MKQKPIEPGCLALIVDAHPDWAFMIGTECTPIRRYTRDVPCETCGRRGAWWAIDSPHLDDADTCECALLRIGPDDPDAERRAVRARPVGPSFVFERDE